MPRSGRTGRYLLGALLTCVFAVGFVGQGHWRIGARPASVAVSAAAVEAVGGAGARPPVRVVVQVAVTNEGSETIRVKGADARVPSAVPALLDPRDAEVMPGRVTHVDLALLLDCRTRERLDLPTLTIALPDAARRTLPITGAGRLVEACARSAPATRPITAGKPVRGGARLIIPLSSPTGRRIEVRAVSAGAVRLGAGGLPLAVGENTPLRLTAPATCPPEWRVAGVPGALTVDTDDGTGTPASVPLRVGSALTDWFLATACRPGTTS
jgi:hypothetical protein